MPRYYVPPALDTHPVRTRPAWRQPLLLALVGLLLAGLLLQPGHELLSIVAGCVLLLLYLMLLGSPYLLGFGLLIYAVTHLNRQRSKRRRPSRPAPIWLWQPWEIVLSLAALLLALCYYAVADGSRWLQRRWRKRHRQQRLALK